jgi:Protein of unknown function (DUF2652)
MAALTGSKRFRDDLHFIVFDVPYLAGVDLRHLPWTERRERLELLARAFELPYQLSPLAQPSVDLARLTTGGQLEGGSSCCTWDDRVMSDRAEPRFASGLLLLADISGYTAFLERVNDAHPELAAAIEPVPPAYDFMVTLLDVVSDGLQPTFRAIQTEGDAVFAVADADVVTNAGREVLDVIRSTYASYHARIDEQRRMQAHECNACSLLPSLELKFVGHAGTFVVQQLSNRTHIAGPAVNLVHRLLKNRITNQTGLRGYALLTDPALELLGLRPSDGSTHTETYEDVGTVSGAVVALSRPPSPKTA